MVLYTTVCSKPNPQVFDFVVHAIWVEVDLNVLTSMPIFSLKEELRILPMALATALFV